MTAFQWTTLACAVVSLGIGLPLALAGRLRPGVPRPRARLVLAWLVVALCPVFLIFLFFPGSTTDGEFGWGQATGAIAAYLVVWGVGIRYSLHAEDLEARERDRHDSAGEVLEDVIGRALAARMEGRRSVPLGTVFDTESGDLAASHHVKRILHVAAAIGEFGRGYGPAGDIGGCVRAVLRCAERLAGETDDIRSVLLPLLGSGSARGNLDAIVPALLDAVADHLECHPGGRINMIYLIAYTKGEHARCRRILDDDPRLQAGRSVKRAALAPTPSATRG